MKVRNEDQENIIVKGKGMKNMGYDEGREKMKKEMK